MTEAREAGRRQRGGDDRRERWQEAAIRLDGRFHRARRSFSDVIDVDHDGWTIRLATYAENQGGSATVYTRAQAYAGGWRGMRLKVRPRGWLDRLAESLGYTGRPPVAPELAERYVLRGEPASRVPSLFADRALGAALLAAPGARLSVKKPRFGARRRLGKGSVEVAARTLGVERDVDKLERLVAVVATTLDALHRIGEIRGGGRDWRSERGDGD